MLDDYAGTYTDGTVTAVINSNGIVIDGEPYEITEYSIQYDMFTGEWNDGEWYIAKQGAKQLILFSTEEDITYVLTSTAIDPVEIPQEFGGVWSKSSNTVAIAYDLVEYNGGMLTVLSYDEKDGSLYATDGEKTYRMFAEEDKDGNPVLLVIVYVDGLSTAYYDMTAVEDAVIVPEVLLGTYEKFDSDYGQFNVVVGLTSVQIEIDNIAQDVTVISTEEVTSWGIKLQAIVIDVNGKEYYLIEGGSDETVTLEREEDRFSITLNRVQAEQPPAPSVTIPEVFHGTFVGEDDGTEYTVTISANRLTIKIGNAAAITITDYEYDDGAIDFMIDGVRYGVYCYEYDDGVDSLYIYSYDGLYATLTREGGELNTEIPESLYGTYEGEDGWVNKTVKVVVDENGIEIYFNGAKQVVTVKNVVSEFYGDNVYVVIDEVEYLFGQYYDSYTFTSAADNGNALYVTLQKQGDDDVTIPEKFYGEFESADEAYLISIDENGISVLSEDIDGDVVIVSYDDYEGFTVTIDGDTYYIQQANNGDEITKIRLLSSDYSLNVVLDKTTQSGGEDEVTIPEKFYGEYAGEDDNSVQYAIVIDSNGVTVTINNVVQVITSTSYDPSYGGTISVIINGAEYAIYLMGSADQYLAFSDADYNTVTLERASTPAPSVTIPEKFYGEYMSEDGLYFIEIKEDAISILTDDDSIVGEFVIEEYDDYEGFTVTIDGDEYYIQQVGYSDEITQIRFMSSDLKTVNVVLDRAE